MQDGYAYERTAREGKEFDPEFTPELTPKEMLSLGIFNGVYMRDCVAEFPKSWFTHAKLAENKPEPKLNYFGVRASQPLSVWREKGWIHPIPRDGFSGTVGTTSGMLRHGRCARQIKRWKAIRRHIGQLVKHCERGDMSCRRRQRQALLHWAYDSRKY